MRLTSAIPPAAPVLEAIATLDAAAGRFLRNHAASTSAVEREVVSASLQAGLNQERRRAIFHHGRPSSTAGSSIPRPVQPADETPRPAIELPSSGSRVRR